MVGILKTSLSLIIMHFWTIEPKRLWCGFAILALVCFCFSHQYPSRFLTMWPVIHLLLRASPGLSEVHSWRYNYGCVPTIACLLGHRSRCRIESTLLTRSHYPKFCNPPMRYISVHIPRCYKYVQGPHTKMLIWTGSNLNSFYLDRVHTTTTILFSIRRTQHSLFSWFYN